jgi:hypothetical protein
LTPWRVGRWVDKYGKSGRVRTHHTWPVYLRLSASMGISNTWSTHARETLMRVLMGRPLTSIRLDSFQVVKNRLKQHGNNI